MESMQLCVPHRSQIETLNPTHRLQTSVLVPLARNDLPCALTFAGKHATAPYYSVPLRLRYLVRATLCSICLCAWQTNRNSERSADDRRVTPDGCFDPIKHSPNRSCPFSRWTMRLRSDQDGRNIRLRHDSRTQYLSFSKTRSKTQEQHRSRLAPLSTGVRYYSPFLPDNFAARRFSTIAHDMMRVRRSIVRS